jgi:hypothetical protein
MYSNRRGILLMYYFTGDFNIPGTGSVFVPGDFIPTGGVFY